MIRLRLPIGRNHPPFIIAEMSGNHLGSLRRALSIVDAVADSGAQALKIQTYTADTMTLPMSRGEFTIRNRGSLWYGRRLYDLYHEAHTPWAWHQDIFDRCRKRGITGFSTPFDISAVDFLEKLNVPLYKMASFENVDIPLIRRVAKTRKPMIISTGLATKQEISRAVYEARRHGCPNVILLKCTSAYPASPSDSHLATIPALARSFRCLAGLSDHTLGSAAAIASVALGASVIEKHVTLRRKDGGVDSAFSMEPQELSQLVQDARHAWQAVGRVHWGPTPAEKPSLAFRRSLYVTAPIRKGERLTPENIRAIRPGRGLAPRFWDYVLRRKAKGFLRPGTPLRLKDLC